MSNVSKLFSASPVGFEGYIIEVESDMTRGLPKLQIVGLGNKAVDEAKERVRSAIRNSMLELPARHFTINLAPAELPKNGTLYDLPIALAVLVSSGQLSHAQVSDALFAGELALDGTLRPVPGAITIAETAKKAGLKTIYLPQKNVAQASLVQGIDIIGITDLKALFLHLKKELILPVYERPPEQADDTEHQGPLLDDVYGQDQAKRALTIAAAGRHNILFTGPPGAGKTMLANVLTSLLPPLTNQEKLEVTKIHSLAGKTLDKAITTRPFRSPHHTSSLIAITGGGPKPKPGEISLAHLGVLFLDELPEYPRSSLESLRQPLEDKRITVSRASSTAAYPADFMLVATMNPCPCGHYGDPAGECTCSIMQLINYQKRLSGPLLDRIDMIVAVSKVPSEILLKHETMEKSQQNSALACIKNANNIQDDRYKCSSKRNTNLSSREVRRVVNATPESVDLLNTASDKLNLSTRSYFKILKVARTIADMEKSPKVLPVHISEALQYRRTRENY